uniref:Uncharacterized protein n=1 Tax=Daucus carota subsp. sativus TaxID=79200 RepID=A0A162B4B3_DAUCS
MTAVLTFAPTHYKQIQYHTWQRPIRHLPPRLTFTTTDHRFTTRSLHITNNRRELAAMSSSGNSLPLGSTTQFELSTEADFNKIVSPDGLISICGFGSLLSENSARSTFPHLINFRVARLLGFRRVFAHAAPIFFQRGIANPQTKVLCARYSDEEYFQIRCKGSQEIYFQRYGQYNIHKIWRDDILPCRVYLRHCVLAAKNLGDAVYNNFMDYTFLGDRKTTIREYLKTAGSGIMEEEPPELLKNRYGG